jgi:hypothetical protein
VFARGLSNGRHLATNLVFVGYTHRAGRGDRPVTAPPSREDSMRTHHLTVVAALAMLTANCSQEAANPLRPGATSGATAASADATPVSTASTRTHGLLLTAVSGDGTGIVNLTSAAGGDTSFVAQITFNVHGLAPNTTYYIQRASEFPASLGGVVYDGTCQRALGLPPFDAVPPLSRFITFVADGAPIPLTTSARGAGAVHLENANNVFADGSAFDVMFRVVSDPSSATPVTDLRTGCVTLQVK